MTNLSRRQLITGLPALASVGFFLDEMRPEEWVPADNEVIAAAADSLTVTLLSTLGAEVFEKPARLLDATIESLSNTINSLEVVPPGILESKDVTMLSNALRGAGEQIHSTRAALKDVRERLSEAAGAKGLALKFMANHVSFIRSVSIQLDQIRSDAGTEMAAKQYAEIAIMLRKHVEGSGPIQSQIDIEEKLQTLLIVAETFESLSSFPDVIASTSLIAMSRPGYHEVRKRILAQTDGTPPLVTVLAIFAFVVLAFSLGTRDDRVKKLKSQLRTMFFKPRYRSGKSVASLAESLASAYTS